jgi:hypothetical protein
MSATAALWAHGAVLTLVGAYALLKERRELGCAGLSVGARQCRDEDSVYVRGTEPSPSDTRADARRKLVSILSYHEKGGVWKRCFLLATVLTYVAYVVQRAATPSTRAWGVAALHLLFFAIMYFYWNFINYHHFRVLRRHGVRLLDVLAPGGAS